MKNWLYFAIGLLVFIMSAWWVWPSSPQQQGLQSSVSVAEAMSGGTQDGYRTVTGPRGFEFPADHGAHPGFKTEWWYYTGNLFTDEGRQFGYQFTIFRNQLNPPGARVDSLAKTSTWNSNQFYLGHFALIDVANGEHVFEERSSRAAAGLAGAQTAPYRIWLENWEIRRLTDEPASDRQFSVRVQATMENQEDDRFSDDSTAINLRITPSKPLVLQGEQGYDKKGAGAGNASHYLSFTRMKTSGQVVIGGQSFAVSGLSWMDHEWSTSALGDEQEGWDWFSLQLSNGYDLMYYQLRNDDGSVSPFTTGALIDADGNKTLIRPEDVAITVHQRWESPHSGATYPAKWTLEIPGKNIRLELHVLVDDQEMDVSVRYYEGMVSVDGEMNGRPIDGHGFIEMTGYEPEAAKQN